MAQRKPPSAPAKKGPAARWARLAQEGARREDRRARLSTTDRPDAADAQTRQVDRQPESDAVDADSDRRRAGALRRRDRRLCRDAAQGAARPTPTSTRARCGEEDPGRSSWHMEPQHTHVRTGATQSRQVRHQPADRRQPQPYWAYCNGVTYNHQIANENAVHMLEHGTVWITYNPKTLPASRVEDAEDQVHRRHRPHGAVAVQGPQDADLVAGVGIPAVPEARPTTRESRQFINALRHAKGVTPEPSAGATGQRRFQGQQSYPGHPFNGG